ncbi:hypothetical protein [Halogeometricum luteum]|uniref:Extracellular repeat, HAF family n=1 Tax=Halogeometricum luteum TaxID=2950537 RepID=A0ABU2FZ86_9EURY|nr:hypothetical protein [Halogeometricum sp. S3BR5-2]MDS0293852.1 hypothetical protein [Halogeometricum sp. S3BR5-2]
MDLVDLGTLEGGEISDAADLNERGTVVGSSEGRVEGAVFTRAVRWAAEADRDPDETPVPTPLPALRSDGRGNSEATAVDARGTAVGSAQDDDWEWRAVRWVDDETVEPLGSLGDGPTSSRAHGVDNRGTVVGHAAADGDVVRAFRWTETEGMHGLGTLRSDGEGRSAATAAVDDGSVVGYSETDDGPVHAFRWTERGGMTDLGALDGDDASAAFGATPTTVVGRSLRSAEFASRTATMWTDGERVELGTFRADNSGYSDAYDVACDVVVGESQVDAGVGHACYWADGRLSDLGTLRADGIGRSRASAVNASGVVVGQSGTDDQEQHAVQWTP